MTRTPAPINADEFVSSLSPWECKQLDRALSEALRVGGRVAVSAHFGAPSDAPVPRRFGHTFRAYPAEGQIHWQDYALFSVALVARLADMRGVVPAMDTASLREDEPCPLDEDPEQTDEDE